MHLYLYNSSDVRSYVSRPVLLYDVISPDQQNWKILYIQAIIINVGYCIAGIAAL
jgi:hypothetical protein